MSRPAPAWRLQLGSHDETLLIEQADRALYDQARRPQPRDGAPRAELPEHLAATLSA